MAVQKDSSRSNRGRPRSIAVASGSRAGGGRAADSGRDAGLNAVDREVIEALTGFRDAPHDRAPLEARYTVRQVVVVETRRR